MTAYYNEFDPKAAAWLRELIKQGHIAEGTVDERSIADVKPGELVGYTQCHFFAGIGVWSYALRSAGWPDDRPVWIGSCPCQPFSAAGKRGGVKDERHLWPEFFRLIAECRPVTVFGEQVASKDGLAWLDAVHADLEGAGYSPGAVDTCAAGFGAPHIRQRLYFVADAEDADRRWAGGTNDSGRGVEEAGGCRIACPRCNGRRWELPTFSANFAVACPQCGGSGMVQSLGARLGGGDQRGPGAAREEIQERENGAHPPIEPRYGSEDAGLLGDALGEGLQGSERCRTDHRENGSGPKGTHGPIGEPGPCNGFWSNAEWIHCRDGKARPIEPGPESLADGLAGELGLVRLVSYPGRPHEERIIYSPLIQKGKARVMRLRGYGNAIVAPVATAFIQAYMEVVG